MPDEITNKMLLEHMQAMKYSLQMEIKETRKDLNNFKKRMEDNFEEARLHRKAMQEDLNATILMQGKHQRKLEKISV